MIYRPIKSNLITQGFGESKACISMNGKVVRKKGECQEGFMDFYESMGMKGHNGWDLACWHGEPVYHSGDEGIMKTEIDYMGGVGVDVIGEKFKLRYWHLKEVVGHDGMLVEPGQLIGYADNTGASSGDHLHWGIKRVINGETINKDNGYHGGVDPTPFYIDKFVLDVYNKPQILSTSQRIKQFIFSLKCAIL